MSVCVSVYVFSVCVCYLCMYVCELCLHMHAGVCVYVCSHSLKCVNLGGDYIVKQISVKQVLSTLTELVVFSSITPVFHKDNVGFHVFFCFFFNFAEFY